MNHGFYIKELRVTGPKVDAAKVVFDKGFNVIAGASDTGKSYIFSCIEFMFGREENPKTIPEASGYTGVYMEIRDYETDSPICLYRKFGETNINYKRSSVNDFHVSKKELSQISIQHSAKNEANISRLLLKLCNLDAKELKKNKENEKASLSFSDVRKLICVHEERIIIENSPFYSSDQYIHRTKDQSFLNLLLTGQDASKLKTIEKEEVVTTRHKSKLELLKDQLERKLEKIREINESGEIIDKKATNEDFNDLNLSLLQTNYQVESLGKERNEIFRNLESLKYKYSDKIELLNRFEILTSHYKSDLQRLTFVEEGSEMLSQLSNQVCPICYQDITEEHEHKITEDDKLYESVLAEKAKINKKLKDLEDTVNELKVTIQNLKSQISKVTSDYDAIHEKLSNQLNPKIEFIRGRLINIVRSEKLKERHILLTDEVYEIEQRISEIQEEMSVKKDGTNKTVVSSAHLQNLCSFIEKRLSAWGYEKNVNVKFDGSYDGFDIIIGPKLRKSYGKGKRGVSYAACMIGLLDYCNSKDKPFPNTLILDSPLTAYESNKQSPTKNQDAVEDGIVNAFYRNLAKLESNKQVIVFDNKVPNKDIQEVINYIEFVGDSGKQGRKGFFH